MQICNANVITGINNKLNFICSRNKKTKMHAERNPEPQSESSLTSQWETSWCYINIYIKYKKNIIKRRWSFKKCWQVPRKAYLDENEMDFEDQQISLGFSRTDAESDYSDSSPTKFRWL